jgi:hypothetical protein
MWDSARKTASFPDKLTLLAGVDHSEVDLYRQAASDCGASVFAVPDWGVVQTINEIAMHGVKHFDADLYFIVGDDTVFATPEWDRALLEHYAALECKAHVYALRDSRDEDGTPHPIGTREYVKAMGYLYTPIFIHFCPDVWMAEIGRANGCFTHLKDYLLVHDKPSDRGQPDETHRRVRDRGYLNRDMYVSASCRHFLEAEKDRLARYISYARGEREHLD